MDVFARWWLVFLLYLWKLALDPSSQGCAYLEIALVCHLCVCVCVLAKWPAHLQGQVEWQVGVPCMCTLWFLPSPFTRKQTRCLRGSVRISFIRFHLPSFKETHLSKFLIWLSPPCPLEFSYQFPTWTVSNSFTKWVSHTDTIMLFWRSKEWIFRSFERIGRVANVVNLIG